MKIINQIKKEIIEFFSSKDKQEVVTGKYETTK